MFSGNHGYICYGDIISDSFAPKQRIPEEHRQDYDHMERDCIMIGDKLKRILENKNDSSIKTVQDILDHMDKINEQLNTITPEKHIRYPIDISREKLPSENPTYTVRFDAVKRALRDLWEPIKKAEEEWGVTFTTTFIPEDFLGHEAYGDTIGANDQLKVVEKLLKSINSCERKVMNRQSRDATFLTELKKEVEEYLKSASKSDEYFLLSIPPDRTTIDTRWETGIRTYDLHLREIFKSAKKIAEEAKFESLEHMEYFENIEKRSGTDWWFP